MPSARGLLRSLCWLMAMAIAPTGCAQHRIPAIDPTGQRIFSGTTTLATHDLLHGLFAHGRQPPPVVPPPPWSTPVSPAPAAPSGPSAPTVPAVPAAPAIAGPACTPAPPAQAIPLPTTPPGGAVVPAACDPLATPLPGAAQPGGPQCPEAKAAYRGPELVVTPSRLVAPVNTEVILAAGICAPDGYYVMRQPLEWMLAQDGVGQIVAVGHESPRDVSLWLRHSPQKVTTQYARAHTSTIAQVLDRGTPSPADDVALQRGQSWISITSPTEGTTHVVVWAPKEQNWERRKATATIYWIDAAWRFPPCATVRAGTAHALTTTITRTSGQPLAGWIVRYEVADGPPATLGRTGTVAEVVTDSAGRATVELLPQSLEAGVTLVRMQVVRPAQQRGDLPQMVVGQGSVGIHWSSPGLTVRALGASTLTGEGAVAYRVEVSNSGDQVTRGVTLSFTPPAGMTVLNSTPPGQLFGQRWVWSLGDLPPGTTAVVEINARAAVSGSIRSTFVATSSDNLKAEGSVTTEVQRASLALKMSGPDTVEVGREARFLIDVTNVGPRTLTNLNASDTFDAGLAHSEGGRGPLVRPLVSALEPGQTHRFAITFVVTQPGLQCHRLDVTADGGHVASARGCVTGVAPVVTPAKLAVRVSGPPSRRAGEVASYTVEVVNEGSTPATNVVLSVTWGVNLELLEATRGHEDDLPRLTTRWRIARLEGGERVARQLNCLCLNPDEQGATVRATVSSQQTPSVSDSIQTVIGPPASGSRPSRGTGGPVPTPAGPGGTTPAPAPQPSSGGSHTPPPEGSPGPGGPGVGGLRLRAAALADPIRVEGTTTVVIALGNDRSVPDRDVALSVQVLDDGLVLTRVPGTTPSPVAAISRQAVDFQPLRELRPGEQLASPYRVEVQGVRPGRHRLRITATSSSSPQGAVTELTITVSGP